MNKQFWVLGYLALIGLIHVNAFLKSEDPIRDTQTDPISYDKKMEEEKDGVKAPSSPRVVFYGGQGFLSKKNSVSHADDGQEMKKSVKKESFNWADWWGDKPSASNSAPASTEAVESNLPPSIASASDSTESDKKSEKQTSHVSEGDSANQKGETAGTVLNEPKKAGGSGDDWW